MLCVYAYALLFTVSSVHVIRLKLFVTNECDSAQSCGSLSLPFPVVLPYPNQDYMLKNLRGEYCCILVSNYNLNWCSPIAPGQFIAVSSFDQVWRVLNHLTWKPVLKACRENAMREFDDVVVYTETVLTGQTQEIQHANSVTTQRKVYSRSYERKSERTLYLRMSCPDKEKAIGL